MFKISTLYTCHIFKMEDDEHFSRQNTSPVTMPTYNWKDITNEFLEASSSLNLGELLHDNSFGLFEAMSAIEMMDPKMDAGMVCNQNKCKLHTLEQGVENGSVKIDNFTMEEQIGIIDTTFACLVTWLEGHSLAQTVFTNVFLHNPYIVEDRCIKVFSICMLKLVDIIKDRINRAGVFEEEDFQPMTYGFKMAADITDMRMCGMVKEVEEEYLKLIKTTRSKASDEKDTSRENDHRLAQGVHARLKFCRLLFSSLVAFSKEKCQGLPEAQKCLQQMGELMSCMKDTIQLGEKSSQVEGKDEDYPTLMGFDPLINQRLLPPTFPRYTKIKTRNEAVEYLGELTEMLKLVCTVTNYKSLHESMEFLAETSKLSPCVLSRSILQLTYVPQNRRLFGTQGMVDVIREQIRAFINPPILNPKCAIYNHPQAKDCMDAFLRDAVRPIVEIIQSCGHNRARQRDRWAHLMEELARLQDEAEKVDAFLHSIMTKQEPNRQHLLCIGTWVLFHTLQVMIRFAQSGFELELYAVHEYHYVFWYLFECLYNWLLSTLTRAENNLLEMDTIIDQQKGGKKRSKKKRKTRPYQREVLTNQGHQSMCGGYYKALVGLKLDDKYKKPEFEFGDEEIRYNHRFAPFGNLATPPAIQYSQFKDMTDITHCQVKPTISDVYSSASKCFQQAKTCYESLTNPNKEIQNLVKIAKNNFVVLKLLAGGHKKDSKEPPDFDFSLHKTFPLIKL
ncbi:unnamed protein product [Owenia fusiformis]|uniref:Protein MAK10 homolog n=1 Tax=Owenia fusiformis TaxID=6347 RepID=A0A8S4PXV7_OWEFU|nr:unnamed protein product [Owenia fusiformis]